MRWLLPLLAAAALAAVGCEKSAPAPVAAPAQTEQARQWEELKAKLNKMTPEERAKYLQEHPEAVQALGATP